MQENTEKGIRERILKGGGAQGFSQIVQILIRFLEVPLLLSFWGVQLYGEWLMLLAIAAYIRVADFGFSTAACREMTIKSGSGDREHVQTIFQSAWLLLFIIFIGLGLIIIGFVTVAPLTTWLDFSSMNNTELKVVFMLLVVHIFIDCYGDLISGGFWVTGDYSISMYYIAATQLFEFFGLAVFVTLGGGPVGAASGFLFGKFVGTALMLLRHYRSNPWLKPGVAQASFGEIKRLAMPAFASLAIPLGNALNIQGIRLIVGLVLGPSAVAVFVPIRTLSRIVLQPGAIISRLIQPELALAFGREDRSLFQTIFIRSCQMAFWGCLGVVLLIGPGAYWIFPIWTRGLIPLQWPTYLILICGVLVNSIWITVLMVPYSINRHSAVALIYILFYGFASLGLGYIGAGSLGIIGIALALFIVEAGMAWAVIHATLPMVGIGLRKWVAEIIRPPNYLFAREDVKFWK